MRRNKREPLPKSTARKPPAHETRPREGLYYLYFSNINLAKQYLQADNLVQSRRFLDACPPQHRGWEWRYLDRLHHTELLTLPGNGQFTAEIFFSKDGKRLGAFARSGDMGVRIWDLGINKPLTEINLMGKGRQFTCAALSPDGKIVALGEQSGAIGFWEADTGRFIREFARTTKSVGTLSFSPDGKWLAAARADVRNGEMLLPFLEKGRNEDLVVFDIGDSKEVFHPKGHGFTGIFSPDSSRLLTLKMNPSLRLTPAEPEHFVALFDTANWKEVASGKLGSAHSYSFSGDGKYLALGGRDWMRNTVFVRVVDTATGEQLHSLAPKERR